MPMTTTPTLDVRSFALTVSAVQCLPELLSSPSVRAMIQSLLVWPVFDNWVRQIPIAL